MISVHLFAGNHVAEWYLPGGLVAVCGAVVGAATPLVDDPAYCPACVREAAHWSGEIEQPPQDARGTR